MPKILIAMPSCHALRHLQVAERETWIAEIPKETDYRFFIGSPRFDTVGDEVFLDVPDGIDKLTHKSVGMFRWALEQGYDFTYKCDLDTLVRPDLLLSSGFEAHDYVGGRNGEFASGGSGYWLSRRAMQAVVRRPISTGPEEDVHAANAVREAGLLFHADPRYVYYPGDVMRDDTISFHLTSIRDFQGVHYDPAWMYETWADQKNRIYKCYRSNGPIVRLSAVPDERRRLRRFR